MDKIPAIETPYKGYRMRSRLEARWAVWMDVLGVRWRYEMERYTNGDRRTYLPDFYVFYPLHPNEESAVPPEAGCWLEIKPHPLDEELEETFKTFSRGTQRSVIVFAGEPWSGGFALYRFTPDGVVDFRPPNRCLDCDGSGVRFVKYLDCFWHDAKFITARTVRCLACDGRQTIKEPRAHTRRLLSDFLNSALGTLPDENYLQKAFTAARQAREEDGQFGPPNGEA